MPRPRNPLLQTLLTKNDSNQLVCYNGRCDGKILNQHSGNIERHIRLIHPELYAGYMQKKNAWKQKVAAKAIATEVAKQKISKSENNKNANIEQAIVEFFTQSKQPLSLLEDRAFKLLVRPTFETLGISVDMQSVMECIKVFSQKLTGEIINDLSGNSNLFTLKIDITTIDSRTLMGISVQYIRERNIENKILAIRELEMGYTSECVKSVIMEILNEYTIDLQQILSISSNDDNNIIAAICALNEELRIVLAEEAEIRSKSIKKETNTNDDSIEEWIEYSASDFASHKIVSLLGGAHTLKLCVEELLDKEEVKVKLEKYRTVVKEFKTQAFMKSNFTAEADNLILDCATNWISTYEMIKRLLEIENISIYLFSEEWTFIKVFFKMLKLIYIATKKLEAEHLCYSDLFIIIMNIVFDLEKMSNDTSTVKLLVDALNKQKQNLLDIEQFNAAVYLDPRIRVCLNAKQKSRAKQYITTLHNRISTLKGGGDSVHSETNESLLMDTSVKQTQSTTSSNPSSPKSFSDYLQNLDFESTPATFSHLEADITLYERQPRLPLETNIIDFWYFQHNSLTDMARLILATPCSDIHIERLLSAFQLIFSDKHNKLTPAEMDHILRVNVNGTFTYED